MCIWDALLYLDLWLPLTFHFNDLESFLLWSNNWVVLPPFHLYVFTLQKIKKHTRTLLIWIFEKKVEILDDIYQFEQVSILDKPFFR